ncbi:MAG TPA: NosD domain-containing protein [Actinomycetota bacterium]
MSRSLRRANPAAAILALMFAAWPAPAHAQALDPLPVCAEPAAPFVPPEPDPPVDGPVSLEATGHLGGRTGPLAKAQGYVYAAVGRRIAVLDVANPRAPRVLRLTATLPADVEALTAASGLLVAATGRAGISVFDLDNPRRPELRSSLRLPGFASGVAFARDHAYVADGLAGLRIVDVSRPSRPRRRGVVYDVHHVRDVVVTKTHAFIAAADEGLLVANIADPRSPWGVKKHFTGGFAFGIAVRSGVAYLADGWRGLRILDVSTPRRPDQVARVPTAGWATDVALRKTTAYVAEGLEGLRVVDVEKPNRPRTLGIRRTPQGFARHVVIRGRYAYLTDLRHGVRVLDVDKPWNPRWIDLVAPLGPVQTLAIADGYAYLASRTHGLRVASIANPYAPRDVATYLPADDVTTMARAGDNLFPLAVGTKIFGAAIPASPGDLQLSGPWELSGHTGQRTYPPEAGEVPATIGGGPQSPAVQGSTLYYPGEAGLYVVDGSTSSPCELGFLQTAGFDGSGEQSVGVSVHGDLAYMSMSSGELFIVDVSDPQAMALLQRLPEPVGRPLVVDSVLYDLRDDELHVYDLTDPVNPVELGSLQLPASTGSFVSAPLAYAGGRLFVAAGGAGLVVVDVADPAAPEIAGRIGLPGKAGAVVVEGEYAYVGTQTGGLSVVRWSDSGSPAAPVAATTSRVAAGSNTRAAEDGVECVVNTTAADGAGSLGECLSLAGVTSVTFDPLVFPPEAPATIAVTGGYTVPDDVLLDGGGAGVIVDGGDTVETAAFTLQDRARVHDLQIRGFQTAAIAVDGVDGLVQDNEITDSLGGIWVRGDRSRIRGNVIGADPTETRNLGVGIDAVADDVVVGGWQPAHRNVMAGTMEIFGPDAVVRGNYIRTDATGTVKLGDSPQAIWVDHRGRGARIANNVVAGDINVAAIDGVTITGNLVGFQAGGADPFDCACHVTVEGAFGRVGGTEPSAGNRIRTSIGIVGENIVLGNDVGVAGDLSWGGLGGAVDVRDSATDVVLGGRSPAAGNLVAAGITLHGGAGENAVIGNLVGTDGGARRYPLETGIALEGAGGNFVVLNEIAGATASGILLARDADSNTIRANTVLECGTGLNADVAQGNVLSLNSVLSNATQGRDAGTGNRWDLASLGNFWSDYAGGDSDGDGIGDVDYPVPPNGLDRFPLMAP